jgi:hypothetical protein
MIEVVGLVLRTGSRLLRFEVWDRAEGVPVPQDAGSDAVSSRGLAMITYFSFARWGWTSRDPHGWKPVHAILGPDPVTEPPAMAPLTGNPESQDR